MRTSYKERQRFFIDQNHIKRSLGPQSSDYLKLFHEIDKSSSSNLLKGTEKHSIDRKMMVSEADLTSHLYEKAYLGEEINENSMEKNEYASQRYQSKRNHQIPNSPIVILDTPGLRDDFYLNILDWSEKNIVSIALDTAVYQYAFETRVSTCLMRPAPGTLTADYITSLCSFSGGFETAVANCSGFISIFDNETRQSKWDYESVDGRRIAAMCSLESNKSLLIVGSAAGPIQLFDIRSESVLKLIGHEKEVCGLAVDPRGTYLASGGNDNRVLVWDLRSVKHGPLFTIADNKAAVKALSWCPWSGDSILATGAGTGDRRLRFWNMATRTCMRQLQTSAQISAVIWVPNSENVLSDGSLSGEIVTCHGFASNELAIWHIPSLTKAYSKIAHTSRILHSAMSPNGHYVATTAANGSLKFWSIDSKNSAT